MLHKDKEGQYADMIQQICSFIETTMTNNGRGKVTPPNDQAIKSKFTIADADYADIMGEVYSQFMANRVADGTGIVDNPPPKQTPIPKTIKIPLFDDSGKPVLDKNGNQLTLDQIVYDPAPPAPYLADPAVSNSSQTPDFVPPAIPVPESNPSN